MCFDDEPVSTSCDSGFCHRLNEPYDARSMIDENKVSVVAVIDPYNSCWADAEFDLYQLNFSYGKEYGLLDAYKRRMGLSANFEMKCCFYELFTEVMHYYDSNTQINEELLSKQATALSFQLQKLKAEL